MSDYEADDPRTCVVCGVRFYMTDYRFSSASGYTSGTWTPADRCAVHGGHTVRESVGEQHAGWTVRPDAEQQP